MLTVPASATLPYIVLIVADHLDNQLVTIFAIGVTQNTIPVQILKLFDCILIPFGPQTQVARPGACD